MKRKSFSKIQARTHYLVSTDKSGTEYWAPKEVDYEVLRAMEDRIVRQQKYDIIRHWIQLRVEIKELLHAIWWYTQRNVIWKGEIYISTYLDTIFSNTPRNT